VPGACAAVDRATQERLLEVDNLSVRFAGDDGTLTAVDGVSLSVDRGQTVVVVGESGSGKSVTSLAIMRLLRSPPSMMDAAAINFRRRDGHIVDLSGLSEPEMRDIRGNEIAMIFQEPMTCLNPVFSVGRQIAETITAHQGTSRHDAMIRAGELLTGLGISDPERRLRYYPHQLSGGMRQRIMIAIALACRPALLIADEPTTALDVTVQAQILELIKTLQKDMGMALLFITHNLGVAAEIADRIVVMYAGRVVEEGNKRDIFTAPRHPYTRGLLKSVPRLRAAGTEDGELQTIPGNVPMPGHLPSGCAFNPRCGHRLDGICDRFVPPSEICGSGHRVQCLRWREIQTPR
jgi:oligopeptide/dipeptide ABC transporter ATP-binding protein